MGASSSSAKRQATPSSCYGFVHPLRYGREAESPPTDRASERILHPTEEPFNSGKNYPYVDLNSYFQLMTNYRYTQLCCKGKASRLRK